jgi:hypothetical protein
MLRATLSTLARGAGTVMAWMPVPFARSSEARMNENVSRRRADPPAAAPMIFLSLACPMKHSHF